MNKQAYASLIDPENIHEKLKTHPIPCKDCVLFPKCYSFYCTIRSGGANLLENFFLNHKECSLLYDYITLEINIPDLDVNMKDPYFENEPRIILQIPDRPPRVIIYELLKEVQKYYRNYTRKRDAIKCLNKNQKQE